MVTRIDDAVVRVFATEWIAAWNAGDLERIFRLYRDDFEMRSPLIAERGFAASGVLRGKDAIRPYWSAGIATASPPLRFELVDAYAGIGTVVIHYRSVGRRYVTEVIELDDSGLAVRGCACHGAPDAAALLPPIYWKTYVAAPAERVFDTLATAAGWDGWFTRGSTMDDRELVMRWRDVARSQHRASLWNGHDGELRCPIVARDPASRFAFQWTTGAHATLVEFRLSRRGPGTVVEVTESGHTHDDLVPAGGVTAAARYALNAAGWGSALELLKVYVERDVAYGQVPPA
jgi:uncharacterized protein YndB with AHSA1/START domain/ketosteroid isomerase-like protein